MRAVVVGMILAVAMPAFAQDTPKKLTSADLAVETHKWDGKQIQTIAQCFFADTDEYRCMIVGANGYIHDAVRVDFKEITPPEMKKAVEDNCDTLDKAMQSKTCRFQIAFTYSLGRSDEHLDGSRLMTILAQDFAGTFSRTR